MSDDDLTPLERGVLNRFRESARASYGHRRGSPAAIEYADKLERGYGGAGDVHMRRAIASLADWLRYP